MVGEAAEKYRGDVNVIGILCDVQNSDGSPIDDKIFSARDIMDETGAEFTNILVSENLYMSVMKGISVVPTIFFVDSEGYRTGSIYTGSKSLSDWSDIINEML